MMEYPDEPAISRNAIEMLTVANEYCLFLEKAESISYEEVLSFLQKICPLLYLKGSLLPEILPGNEEFIERFVTEENWETIFRDLLAKFGPSDKFYLIDPAENADYEPVQGSLAEKFADIYQDLKDFVMLYQKNTHTARENAVAECRFFFETHWGPRTLTCMQALHTLIYSRNLQENSEQIDI